MPEALFFINPLLLIGVAGVAFAMLISKRRHEQMAQQASQRGWTYHKKLPEFKKDVVADVGGSKSGRNFVSVFEGTADGSVFYAGTAQWDETSGAGDDSRTETYRKRILIRPIPLNPPRMRLSKEHLFSKIFNRDIKTEWEEFNKIWLVSGDDERFVSAVLSPSMQEWLMNNKGYNYVLRPGWVAVYSDENRKLKYEDVDRMLELSRGFTSQIVPFIWQDYGPA